jgi:hypothetical protein
MFSSSINARAQAGSDFEEARKQARWEQWRQWFGGGDKGLIPFEALRAELREKNPYYLGVQQVALDKIVGSVGRYQDFNGQFMPLSDALRERWVRVEALALEQTGWPPVELYQVGEVYFVRDGNHRVAIARQLGLATIEANVLFYPEAEGITTADSLNEIVLKLGERNFMAKTNLDTLYPDHDIRFTVAGRYQHLLAQIEQMRHNLALIDRDEVCHPSDISYEEAVRFWYEVLYLPATDIIHASGLLAQFPNRTAADLFVWFFRYRQQLQELYCGDHIGNVMAQVLEENQPSTTSRIVNRFLNVFGLGSTAEPVNLETAPGDELEQAVAIHP